MDSREKIMLILSLVFVFLIALVASVIAYAGGMRGDAILGVCFFLTFGITVVLAQVIPAAILFSCLAGAIFSPRKKIGMPILSPRIG